MKHVDSGIILFLGNSEMPMNFTDNTYHFRQDSTFLYFFGLTKPGLAAIIDADSGESVIYGDNPSIDEIVWTGPQTELAEMASLVGVPKTASYDSLFNDMSKAKNAGRQIHFLAPYRHDHQIELGSLLSITAEEIAASWSKELVEGIVAQRLYKSSEELEELERAVDITAVMHLTAMREAKPGMKEQHIVARVMEVAAENGGHFSFQPIVTINGETKEPKVGGAPEIKPGEAVDIPLSVCPTKSGGAVPLSISVEDKLENGAPFLSSLITTIDVARTEHPMENDPQTLLKIKKVVDHANVDPNQL